MPSAAVRLPPVPDCKSGASISCSARFACAVVATPHGSGVKMSLVGAITGWAFTNDVMPAVRSLPGVAKSVLTPIPDTYQAGQWTYSPSGLPIAILTGKLAADRVLKDLA